MAPAGVCWLCEKNPVDYTDVLGMGWCRRCWDETDDFSADPPKWWRETNDG